MAQLLHSREEEVSELKQAVAKLELRAQEAEAEVPSYSKPHR